MDDLVVAIVILDCDFDCQRVGHRRFPFEMNRLWVKHAFVFIQVLHEFGDYTFVEKLVRLFGPLVVDADADSRIQESFLTQALRERVEVEFGYFEDLVVVFERYFRSAPFGLASRLEPRRGYAANVLLLISRAVSPNLDPQQLGEEVHYRNTDAVQSARNLVRVRVKLAARVKLGQHHLGRRKRFLVMTIDRAAADVL